MYRIESKLKEIALENLRPTQMTVGFKEVDAKRKSWSKLKAGERKKAMHEEFFPAVLGPGKKYFVLDRHHAALALTHEKAERVQVGLVRDLSMLSSEDFWIFLDHYSWMHCYDAEGKRRPLDEIPKRFQDMKDDPYRSLAGELRDQGGYSKVDVPFLEFLWANQLRQQIPARLLKQDPDEALAEALKLARSKEWLSSWLVRQALRKTQVRRAFRVGRRSSNASQPVVGALRLGKGVAASSTATFGQSGTRDATRRAGAVAIYSRAPASRASRRR